MINKKTLVLLSIILVPFIFTPHALSREIGKKDIIDLNLKKTIFIAYTNNRDIQIQEEEVAAARAELLGAVSEFLPKINLDTGYNYDAAVLNIGSRLPGSFDKDPGVASGYKNSNTFGFSAKETFYAGGANIANCRKAAKELKIQEEALRAKRLDIEYIAKLYYYQLLLAYETERIMRNLVEQAEAHYKYVSDQYGQGTVSRFDLLQSKVHVSNTMPGLIDAANQIDITKAEIKKLLAINMMYFVETDDRLEYSFIKVEEGKFLDYAYVYNPTMRLKKLGIDASRFGIRAAQAGHFPQVDGTANFLYRSSNLQNMFNYYHNKWTAGIQVTLPLYDGSETKARIEEARARYAQANISKADYAEQIALDVKKACLNMISARALILSQEDSIVEAREALRLSEVRYRTGVGINLDVLDAQVALSEVELNLARGIYDYLMARSFLDKTMGREYLEEAE